MACHHRPWTAYMVGRSLAWNARLALIQHTRSEQVGCGMTSSTLDSSHSRTTSAVACHHSLWNTHSVGQHRACLAIISLGKHTLLNDVGCGMPSSPLDITHDRATLSVACHHRSWKSYTVKQSQVWHAHVAHGNHTRLEDFGRNMPS